MTPAPIEVLAPAVAAGAVAIAVTMAIERWGGRVGGLIGSLPTTIVPAAAGMWRSSPDDAAFVAALCVTPVGMLVDAGFLYLWRVLPGRMPAWGLPARLALMTALTLTAWAVAAAAVVVGLGAARAAGVSLPAVGLTATLFMAVAGVLACRHAPPTPRGRNRVGPVTLLARGGMAGAAIGVAVWLAAHGGALAAGMAAVFPAIFLTTMVSLWLSQGEAVPAGAVGPMMLGATSVAAYALVATLTLPAMGAVWGSVVAWPVAVLLTSIPAATWLARRARLRPATGDAG